ncbi:MAG: hypothetical protein VYB50_03840 [Candidatus Thermoplasmatota archaeon]|nr:hypothetical protein [Candidatus Thermoplasmatota archaeon]
MTGDNSHNHDPAKGGGGGDLSGIWQSFEYATNVGPVDRYEFRRDGERYYVVRPPGGAIDEGDYFTFDGSIGRHKTGLTNKMLLSGELHWDLHDWKYVSRREGTASPPSTGKQSIRNDVGKIALKSVHGKYLSAQPDGRAEWNRDIASEWEYFHLEERQGGKITLKGAHGMYVSAQADGGVQINRQGAPPTGWEEFTVEDRGNNVICLKSVHGKYLSAQMDGTAQWNRDSAPKGGWEEIRFVPQVAQNQEPAPAQNQEPKPTSREESIEILEAVVGKPVRFKINNLPSSNDAWVGIYPQNASDQDHGAQNKRWKWLRDIDVNNASFPKQAVGSHSIRVFSDGGHTLHERKDFTVHKMFKAEPLDPVVVKSIRKKAWTGLAIGLLLLAPGNILLVFGLLGGFDYEAVSSATFEIEDADGQGVLGFVIFIEGETGDFDGNGFHDFCENVVISANHTPYPSENLPDESREVFYTEIAGEDGEVCGSHHYPEKRIELDGTRLVKIGRACDGCKNGTITITAQTQEGGEVLMWIKNQENYVKLGMLIPGAIMMIIGALTVIGSLGLLAKTRQSRGRSQATSVDSNHLTGNLSDAENWFAELVRESEAIALQISTRGPLSHHERVSEQMDFPDKAEIEEDILESNRLKKWYVHLLRDPLKAKVIARELGLEIGSSRYDFEGDWKPKGLFAYKSGKYAGQAYFGLGGEGSELLDPLDDEEKYRPWDSRDSSIPKEVQERWLIIEPHLARSYYLKPPL